MGKSLGNFITLEELFSGKHPLLTQPFHPMTVRFFILQAHYRGPLDFSDDALAAAGKGLKRLLLGQSVLNKIPVSESATISETLQQIEDNIYQALCDDLNTPVALASLFDLVTWIHTTADANKTIALQDRKLIERIYDRVVNGILGLKQESEGDQLPLIRGLIDMILEFRKQARQSKNWKESDRIRDQLSGLGVRIKDTKTGTDWEI